MENYTMFNKTTNMCFIKPRLPNFPNGLHLSYDSCPESINNNTKKMIARCCLEIILKVSEESKYIQVQTWLTHNSASLLVVPAIILNMLSLIVLLSFRKLNSSDTTINFYMKFLCIFDTFTIVSKFFHELIVVRNATRKSPFKLSSFVCKLLHFTESTFSTTAIYIIILMGFDKLICVAFPLKASTWLRPKRSKVLTFFNFLLASIYSAHHIFNQTINIVPKFEKTLNQSGRRTYECIAKKEYLA
jgi:hypothetical protein